MFIVDNEVVIVSVVNENIQVDFIDDNIPVDIGVKAISISYTNITQICGQYILLVEI